MTPAVPLKTAPMLTSNFNANEKNKPTRKTTDIDHSKMIQVGLSDICLQTLKYSETHRSGGHFDVEINQQTSQPAQ